MKVSGARRIIWGTLKSTSAFTVSSTLKKLSTLGNLLNVRKKFKINEKSGRTHWWFVVKGSETDLENLEREWDHVQLQTGWKLEICLMSQLPSNPESPNQNARENHDASTIVKTSSVESNPNMNDNDNVMISNPTGQNFFIVELEPNYTNTELIVPSLGSVCKCSVPTNCTHLLDKINILYYNVRSLLPKIDNLRILCCAYSPDILCVVESWLNSNISDQEISLQDYSIFRLDRSIQTRWWYSFVY